MVAVVLGMLVCIGCAVWVVGLVAVPARREGREVLTPLGEDVIARVTDRGQEAGARPGRRSRSRSSAVADLGDHADAGIGSHSVVGSG